MFPEKHDLQVNECIIRTAAAIILTHLVDKPSKSGDKAHIKITRPIIDSHQLLHIKHLHIDYRKLGLINLISYARKAIKISSLQSNKQIFHHYL